MRVRVGLGPVFAYEWLMASRRWQGYAMRSLAVILLLAAMAPVWFDSSVETSTATGEVTISRQSRAGNAFLQRTAILLLGLAGLAAPAATAGAICQDKSRGNLALLMSTDLSDVEIVLGKLAAGLVPLVGMILCVVPVLILATHFGGVDPVGVLGALLTIFTCAVFGCSLALTLSVWGKKTHEVLMATYTFGIGYLLLAPLFGGLRTVLPATWWPTWLPSFWQVLRYNPVFLVLAPFGSVPFMAPVTIATQGAFFGLGLTTSAILIGMAIWRIRPVVAGELGRGDRPTKLGTRTPTRLGRTTGTNLLGQFLDRAWPRPSLDGNPVLWRECRRRRLSRWNLAVWGSYALLGALASAYVIAEKFAGLIGARDLGAIVNSLQVASGLLLLSVSTPTSLAEDRQRGNLDVLLATPLPTRAIVWGKWWGAFRAVPLLLPLPMLVSLVLSSQTGRSWGAALLAALILAYGAAVTSLGLAMATWIPRMGRAAAVTVGLYSFLCIGWIPLALILFGEAPGDDGLGVGAGSPLMGVVAYSRMLAGDGLPHEFAGQTLWTLFWTIAHAAAALCMLLATFATFNRCLGRIDDPTIMDRDDSTPVGETAPVPSACLR